MIKNYLTIKPSSSNKVAVNAVMIQVLLLVLATTIYLNSLFGIGDWLAARSTSVFEKKEYWRAWTTLFIHGDLGHLISNLFLFIPFAYFLTSYFGFLFFPFFGFLVGGIINLIVLKTLPPHVWLIGVSGVVYWMGAAWITLSYLIDKREKSSKRLIKVIGISAILFIPDTFKADVSYLSHFLGYFLGIISAAGLYLVNRKKFRAADYFEEIIDSDEDFELEYNQQNNIQDDQEIILWDQH